MLQQFHQLRLRQITQKSDLVIQNHNEAPTCWYQQSNTGSQILVVL
jgi:hypothetical protein